MFMPNNSNSIASQNCHSENSPSRKEFTKTIKCIIESKSKKESKSKSNKKDTNDNVKDSIRKIAMKRIKTLPMTKTRGTKFSPSKSPSPNQWPRKIPQQRIILFITSIGWIRIPVLLIKIITIR